jgi:hypothetical protein
MDLNIIVDLNKAQVGIENSDWDLVSKKMGSTSTTTRYLGVKIRVPVFDVYPYLMLHHRGNSSWS